MPGFPILLILCSVLFFLLKVLPRTENKDHSVLGITVFNMHRHIRLWLMLSLVQQCRLRSFHPYRPTYIQVNADLKRLLVSALAGNSNLADQLIGLTSDNVNLSGQSRSLAAQQAALAEVANTAGIAADVWRAKCLAGRVVATEAARRVGQAERKAQLARHALAHLLGERARLRLELGQACASLLAATSLDHDRQSIPDEVGVTPPIVQDTLGLATLCTNLVDKYVCQVGDRMPILCQSDSPGENLALRVSFCFINLHTSFCLFLCFCFWKLWIFCQLSALKYG